MLFEAMLAEVTEPGHEIVLDEATVNRLFSTVGYHLDNNKSTKWPTYHTPPQSRVPSIETNHSAMGDLAEFSPANVPVTPAPASLVSKADLCADWRNRGANVAQEAASPFKASSTLKGPSPPSKEVMTIDDLLEKFGSPENSVSVNVTSGVLVLYGYKLTGSLAATPSNSSLPLLSTPPSNPSLLDRSPLPPSRA